MKNLPQSEVDRLFDRDYETAKAWNDELDHLIKIGQFQHIPCLPVCLDEETARFMFGEV